MKSNLNKILLIFVLLPITLITVTYASLSEEMIIDGEATLRVEENIRISNIKIIEQSNGAYETYNNKFDKERTNMFVTLPNKNSTITYEVTITNNSEKNYDVNDIVVENETNQNIKYNIDLSKGNIINGNSSKTFTIKLYYEETSLVEETEIILTIRYEFVEHIDMYVAGTYDYTGTEKTFVVPYTGIYQIEVWGAQGGGNGGYGGYSSGFINLQENQTIFITVGGQGARNAGGYNGGGNGQYLAGSVSPAGYGGGGATHIASSSGLLKNTAEKNVYIIAGGGGGGSENNTIGGHAGGYIGNDGTGTCYSAGGGTQTSGGKAGDFDSLSGGYGYGGDAPYGKDVAKTYGAGGGGSGYYGGGGSSFKSGSNCAGGGAGGSGYIGNLLLNNKYMMCYECATSEEIETKTISTKNTSNIATSDYSKKGNGYAKITFIERTYS